MRPDTVDRSYGRGGVWRGERPAPGSAGWYVWGSAPRERECWRGAYTRPRGGCFTHTQRRRGTSPCVPGSRHRGDEEAAIRALRRGDAARKMTASHIVHPVTSVGREQGVSTAKEWEGFKQGRSSAIGAYRGAARADENCPGTNAGAVVCVLVSRTVVALPSAGGLRVWIFVSTDRAKTWQEHVLPDLLSQVKAPKPRRHGWGVGLAPTSSGVVLAVVGRHLGNVRRSRRLGVVPQHRPHVDTVRARRRHPSIARNREGEHIGGLQPLTCSFTSDLAGPGTHTTSRTRHRPERLDSRMHRRPRLRTIAYPNRGAAVAAVRAIHRESALGLARPSGRVLVLDMQAVAMSDRGPRSRCLVLPREKCRCWA